MRFEISKKIPAARHELIVLAFFYLLTFVWVPASSFAGGKTAVAINSDSGQPVPVVQLNSAEDSENKIPPPDQPKASVHPAMASSAAFSHQKESGAAGTTVLEVASYMVRDFAKQYLGETTGEAAETERKNDQHQVPAAENQTGIQQSSLIKKLDPTKVGPRDSYQPLFADIVKQSIGTEKLAAATLAPPALGNSSAYQHLSRSSRNSPSHPLRSGSSSRHPRSSDSRHANY